RVTFIVRTAQPVSQVTKAIVAAVAMADSGQAVSRIRTMWQTAYAKERQRVLFNLIGTFAIIAVTLAAVGVYGVMAQIVSQRTNEIGIRMALGAGRADVRRLVLLRGGMLIGTGLAAGFLGALAETRLLRAAAFLWVRPGDPVGFTLFSSVLVLFIVAIVACCLPAYRASRIDPIRALRHD